VGWPKKKVKKNLKGVTSHVFASTTCIVTAPLEFAFMIAVAPMAWLYITSFIEICPGVLEPLEVKIWLLPLLWLLTFITACATVQAMILIHAMYSELILVLRNITVTSRILYIGVLSLDCYVDVIVHHGLYGSTSCCKSD